MNMMRTLFTVLSISFIGIGCYGAGNEPNEKIRIEKRYKYSVEVEKDNGTTSDRVLRSRFEKNYWQSIDSGSMLDGIPASNLTPVKGDIYLENDEEKESILYPEAYPLIAAKPQKMVLVAPFTLKDKNNKGQIIKLTYDRELKTSLYRYFPACWKNWATVLGVGALTGALGYLLYHS
jgi:hypothetical protein